MSELDEAPRAPVVENTIPGRQTPSSLPVKELETILFRR